MQTTVTCSRWRLIMGILLIIPLLVRAAPQVRTMDDIRDQVMINTARLNSIEDQIEYLRVSAIGNTAQLAAYNSDINLLKRQMEDMIKLLQWLVGISITTILGLTGVMLRYYLDRRPRHPVRKDQ